MERLQKIIAESGVTSRRKAEDLIKEGKVTVNGRVATLGEKASISDEIIVNGKRLAKEDKEYYLLNKPRGVICSKEDKEGRKLITDCIATDKRIYPVGRLDYDTTGAIILTNDGELTNILEHPRNSIERIYYVKVCGLVTKEEKLMLERGIIIDGHKAKAFNVKVKKYDKDSNKSYVRLTLKEGKNHEVKNMFMAIKHPVDKLKREVFAGLTINDLKSGDYRKLTIKEVKRLYALKKED